MSMFLGGDLRNIENLSLDAKRKSLEISDEAVDSIIEHLQKLNLDDEAKKERLYDLIFQIRNNRGNRTKIEELIGEAKQEEVLTAGQFLDLIRLIGNGGIAQKSPNTGETTDQNTAGPLIPDGPSPNYVPEDMSALINRPPTRNLAESVVKISPENTGPLQEKISEPIPVVDQTNTPPDDSLAELDNRPKEDELEITPPSPLPEQEQALNGAGLQQEGEPEPEKEVEISLDRNLDSDWVEARLKYAKAQVEANKKENRASLEKQKEFEDARFEYEEKRKILEKEIREKAQEEGEKAGVPQEEIDRDTNNFLFEELVKKEYQEYKKVLDANREKTSIDKAMEIARKALNTKVGQWYVNLSWEKRLILSSAIITLGASAFGTVAATGALTFGAKRLARGAISFGATTLTRGGVQKIHSIESINKKREEEIEALGKSDVSLEEKSEKIQEINEKYDKKVRWKKAAEIGTAVLAGAGTAAFVGMANEAVGTGGATRSALENTNHPVPKPVVPTETPQAKVATAEIPTKPVVLPMEKIFENPDVLVQKVESGDSLWKMIKKVLDENEEFRDMDNIQKQNAISYFTTKALNNPNKYGLTPDSQFGVRVEVGKNVDLTKLFNNEEEYKKVLKGALALSNQQREDILEAQKINEYWLAKNPGKPLTQENLDEITKMGPKIRSEIDAKFEEIERLSPKPAPELPTIKPSEIEVPEAIKSVELVVPEPEIPKTDLQQQIESEIADAKQHPGILEGGGAILAGGAGTVGVAARNPFLVRSLTSDSESARDIGSKYGKDIQDAFKLGIDGIYGERNWLGRKIEGLKTKKWREIDGYLAKEVVQYIDKLERGKLSPKFLKILESPQNQKFIKEMDSLIKFTEGVLKPREGEHPGEYMMRLSEFAKRKQSQLQSLPKAA